MTRWLGAPVAYMHPRFQFQIILMSTSSTHGAHTYINGGKTLIYTKLDKSSKINIE